MTERWHVWGCVCVRVCMYMCVYGVCTGLSQTSQTHRHREKETERERERENTTQHIDSENNYASDTHTWIRIHTHAHTYTHSHTHTVCIKINHPLDQVWKIKEVHVSHQTWDEMHSKTHSLLSQSLALLTCLLRFPLLEKDFIHRHTHLSMSHDIVLRLRLLMVGQCRRWLVARCIQYNATQCHAHHTSRRSYIRHWRHTYTYIHTHTHIQTHAYKHTHTHTHTHTNTHTQHWDTAHTNNMQGPFFCVKETNKKSFFWQGISYIRYIPYNNDILGEFRNWSEFVRL